MIEASVLLLIVCVLILWVRLGILNRQIRDLRDRVPELSPVPLKRVYVFNLSLTPEFLSSSLKATPEEAAYLQKVCINQFIAPISVTIEDWGSHRRIAPERFTQGVEQQILYAADQSLGAYYFDCPLLWSTPLQDGKNEQLELRLVDFGSVLQLGAVGGRFRSLGDGCPMDQNIFLSVPLNGDPKLKRPDEPDEPEGSDIFAPEPYRSTPWHTCYESKDAVGPQWTLWVIDNQKFHEVNPQPTSLSPPPRGSTTGEANSGKP